MRKNDKNIIENIFNLKASINENDTVLRLYFDLFLLDFCKIIILEYIHLKLLIKNKQ